jgi:hypothetical protein
LKSTALPGFERPGSSNIEIDPEQSFCNALKGAIKGSALPAFLFGLPSVRNLSKY